MRRAWLDGIDLAPPLTAIVTRAIYLVAGTGPVVTRLPAMIGFLAAIVLTVVLVRRRTNMLVAIAAACLLALTPALSFGVEARGYGLTLGLAAAALYGWSEAAAGRRVRGHLAVMAVALAAGMWAHYYFVLIFVPIGIGEAVRQWHRGGSWLLRGWLLPPRCCS